MSTIRRIGPKLFLCGIVGGLFLIGWATRHSIAQSRTQDAPPPIAPVGASKEAPPQVKSEQPKAEPSPALPAPTEPLAAPSLKDSPTTADPFPNPSSAPAPAPVIVGPDHSPIEAEDPERVATEFLDQNQRIAEAQLKALKEEAEKLKARLTKVEAGIKRWDRLLVALKRSHDAVETGQAIVVPGGRPADQIVSPKAETEPTDLSPVSPAPAAGPAPEKAGAKPATLLPR